MRVLLLAGLLTVTAAPAFAIDCIKAATPVEKTICGKPALKAADDALGAAYSALRASLDAAGKAALRGDQLKWLKQRDGICSEWDQASPPDAACLMRVTVERTDMLTAKPLRAGPGAPAFRPVFYRRVDEAASIEVSVVYPELVDASSPALKRLDALLAGPADGADQAVEGPYGRIMSFRIGYASGRFVSVRYDAYEFTGGAHGMSYGSAVNFLMAEGRALTLADFIDANGRAGAIAACRDSIRAQKRERGVPVEMIEESLGDEALATAVDQITAWSFDDRGALVHYNPYDLGSYAEGDYDCVIPWARLRGLSIAGSKLPFD